MKGKPHRRAERSMLKRAVLCLAVLLTGAALFLASWLQFLDGGLWQVAASCFGIGAVVGLIGNARARATQRLRVALDPGDRSGNQPPSPRRRVVP
jgi:hypothetical protein